MQKKKIDLHYHKACKNHAEVFMIFPHFNEIFNVPYSTYCKAIFLFFVSIHIYFSIEIWWKWKILLCVIISHAKIMLKLHDFAFFSFHLNPLQITIFKFLVSIPYLDESYTHNFFKKSSNELVFNRARGLLFTGQKLKGWSMVY